MIKALVNALDEDPDMDVKYAAAAAIGSFGTFAATVQGVIPTLNWAALQKHDYVSRNAKQALALINAKKVTPKVEQLHINLEDLEDQEVSGRTGTSSK